MTSSSLRTWHAYLGAFMAPSLLFFAITGGMQIFYLNKARPTYQPPALIEELGRVHKDQVFALEQNDPRPDTAPGHKPPKWTPPTPPTTRVGSLYLLKWFFTLVALSLVASTLIGLWIGLSNPRRRRMSLILLALGVAIPIGLLCLPF